jgi:predicted DNA-binding transcriptional regulator AlpA
MAEASSEQAAFGWTAEAQAKRPGGGARRSGGAAPRQQRPAQQRTAGNAGEPQLPPDNELWDVRAAARFLKRSVSWVYHRAEDGTLPVRRLGGWGIRFIPGELRAWVESSEAGRPR